MFEFQIYTCKIFFFYRNLITTKDIHRIQPKQERMSSGINLLQTYPNLMQPKIVLQRIGQGFLIDCLEPSEDTREYSFCDSKLTAEIKTERKSSGQKRKQSSFDDDDDDEIDSSRIALRKRKSISFVEIDNVTPKRRRNKRPKSKHIRFHIEKQDSREELTSSLTSNKQSKRLSTRLSIRNE